MQLRTTRYLIVLTLMWGARCSFYRSGYGPSRCSPLMLLTIVVTLGAMLFTVVRVPETVPAAATEQPRAHLLRRAFTFDLRAEASFAWLLAARGCNMLAINTIVTFLLYYVRDYLGVTDVGEANAKLGHIFAGGLLLDSFNGFGHNLGYPVVFATGVLYLAIGTIMLIKVTEPQPQAAALVEPAVGFR